jgi:hypothetical protein
MLSAIRMSSATRSELRRLGESPFLSQQSSILPVRPSAIAAAALAGFGLGSHFVPPDRKVLRDGMIVGAVLSGLAGAYLFYIGK